MRTVRIPATPMIHHVQTLPEYSCGKTIYPPLAHLLAAANFKLQHISTAAGYTCTSNAASSSYIYQCVSDSTTWSTEGVANPLEETSSLAYTSSSTTNVAGKSPHNTAGSSNPSSTATGEIGSQPISTSGPGGTSSEAVSISVYRMSYLNFSVVVGLLAAGSGMFFCF
jgi:hypothetical protein